MHLLTPIKNRASKTGGNIVARATPKAGENIQSITAHDFAFTPSLVNTAVAEKRKQAKMQRIKYQNIGLINNSLIIPPQLVHA